jgi:transcriptional regulator GlxA family with amidase domain
MTNPALLNALREAGDSASWVTSVCTGAFLLAEAGLLADQRVTTHWEDIADLRQRYPALDVQENIRWVEDGNRLTSAGISAGIDMSLHLVEKLYNRELAQKTARQMDYSWQQ